MKRLPRSSGTRSTWRILVVEGMELTRAGFKQVLGAVPEFVISAATGDYDTVPELIEYHRPHIIIVEPFQQDRDGLTWIKDLHARFPQPKILIASGNSEATYAERLLRAGASGYWMKNGSTEGLLAAIKIILSGDLYASPTVGLLALRRMAHRSTSREDRLGQLSDRELAVFSFLASRHSTGDIASKLGISRKTVETHYAHIKLKLGYADAAALRRGARESLG